MDRNRFLKMADNPDFIPGIFNYFDRWCERCPLSSRCFLFATEKEMRSGQVAGGRSNEDLWKEIHEAFDLTMDLVSDLAQEQGIDPATLDLDEETNWLEVQGRGTKESPLVQAAAHYASLAAEWLTNNATLLEQEQIDSQDGRSPDIGDDSSIAGSIRSALEIVQWYQHFIRVKLMRALDGGLMNADDGKCDDDFPSDVDGSAKVALIGIDRSIGAWERLQGLRGDPGQDAMEILIHLRRLRTAVEKHFIHVRSFVRPGFDQEV